MTCLRHLLVAVLAFLAAHGHHRKPEHWNASLASEYGEGDGQMGGPLACGGKLGAGTVEVANRSLPCGTRVTFRVGRVRVPARVEDRGPYCCGREWDLSYALARRLGLAYPWSGSVQWRLG